MEISIQWSRNANKQLIDIFHYIADEKQNKTAAKHLVQKIRESADTLKVFPQAGNMEPLLKGNPISYRSFVADKHYKIIYAIKDEQTIRVYTVWDCRQDPMKLQQIL